MNLILLIARLLLAGVFAVAGGAKLADPAGSRKSMRDFGVPEALAGLAGVLLPLAELACAIALFPAASAWFGAAGILALLVIFIAGISLTLLRGRRPDCHCFGQMQSKPIGWDLVVRNVVLAGIAGFVVAQGEGNIGPGFGAWWSSLDHMQAALMLLTIGFVGLLGFQLWTVTELLRQNGRLMLRVEALEKGAPAPAKAPEPTPDPGLPVNTPAPAFSLLNLEGETVPTQLLFQQGKPLLFLFIEPGCGSCDAAMPDIARWQKEHAERLMIVPISRGDVKANRAKTDKAGVTGVLLQKDAEVMQAYHIAGTPGAVLVKHGTIASEAALGQESIARLVARSSVPDPISKGDAVPAMTLPDLSGGSLDVATIRRRTLVLFWNPGCGFCNRMLNDLKAWEAKPPQGAPELLVISAGSAEDIRKQGIRARVLLDPYFAASQVFQSGGTPSAVMIGEDGRIASEVGVGADEVLQLAGVVPAA